MPDRSTMQPIAVSLVLLLAAPLAAASAQDPCPAPAGSRIASADGVRLHVLEWGGAGVPLLFLSGILGSAHTFDDFAPLFTDTHRVIGLTRRGIPPSDTAGVSYSAETLTADVLAVMDSLKLPAAHLVGWSFGGNEATLLAARNPERVLSLTLLDSYDANALLEAGDSLKQPLPPPFLAFDSTSPLALQWREQRQGNRPLPLGFICANNRFAPDGRYLGPTVRRALRDSIADVMRRSMPRLPYRDIRKPVLALFAVPRGVPDMFPAYPTLSVQDQERAATAFRTALAARAIARARLRHDIPTAVVAEVPGAAHAIFRSHPEIVFRTMRTFLTRLQDKTP